MYVPNPERYAAMAYRRCGKSGLKLPEVSLGLWHNFGDTNTLEHMEAISRQRLMAALRFRPCEQLWSTGRGGGAEFRKDSENPVCRLSG